MTVQCPKCGEELTVDGEWPKLWAYCDTCHVYADCDEAVIDFIADREDTDDV